MKTGFIGAGKVGFSLGKMFAESGLPLTGYYSRQREAAQEAAAFTGTRAYSDLCELVQDSDAIFLTVPDRAITPVYLELRSFYRSGKKICQLRRPLFSRHRGDRCARSFHPSAFSRQQQVRFVSGTCGCFFLSGGRKKRHPGMENAAGVLRLHGADHRCSGQAALSCGLRHGE